ncbi:YitT family protein [Terrisporobacter petrolearius]|uniref:YitT family protein n=1 Tax=Terrisporobacter petrolearius TaxID=1460447 RepID=UPI001D15EC28|nr:YitT family protein [Terrisporobacter petrolearius]MCC3865811.1 YitT family protein [Terrisporobacter petrolearius]
MKSALKFNEVIILMVGCLFMAVSINMFLNPHNIAPGGLTGVSIIINTLTGLPIWLINITFDIPLFLFAFRILGKKDASKTLLGIIFLTASLKITENLGNINVTNDVLLSSISGGIVLGIALGLIFRINGSTGGTDLIGILANKAFSSLSVPTLMGFADGCIVALSGIVSKNIEIALYSAIALYIIVKVSDIIVEGINTSTSFTIISDKYMEIGSAITDELQRGATILKGQGLYTGSEKNVLLVVVSKKEVITLKKLVKQTDPYAFIIITDIFEALGEGFKPM